MPAILARKRPDAPQGLMFFRGSMAVVETDGGGVVVVAEATMFQSEAFVFPSTETASDLRDLLATRDPGSPFEVFPWIGSDADPDAALIHALKSQLWAESD